jgi:hypothetical protein
MGSFFTLYFYNSITLKIKRVKFDPRNRLKSIFMKIKLLSLLIIVAGCSPRFDRAAEEKSIRTVLARQEAAWNEGNIDQFMEDYWKSDSLMFIGSKITYSWDSTIARYHKSYPNVDAMGKLNFTFYDFKFIGSDACLVTGRYHLKRIADEPTGMFTLLLRKMNGQWLIVYDHTS